METNTYYSYIEDEDQIDLFSVFLEILYRWKIIVAIAFALALCAGGFKYYSYCLATNENGLSVYECEMQEYYKNKAENDHTAALINNFISAKESAIDCIEKQIAEKVAYSKLSPIMALDPANTYESTVRFFVGNNLESVSSVEEMVENRNIVLSSYMMELQSAGFRKGLANILGTEEAYVSDLFSTWTDSECFLYVYVRASDKGTIESVMSYVDSTLEEFRQGNKDLFESFKVNKTDYGISIMSRETVNNMQESIRTSIVSLNESLTSEVENLTAMKMTGSFDVSAPSYKKTVAKFTIIGFAIGGVLSVCWYGLWAVLGGKLGSHTIIEKKADLTLLGTIGIRKKTDLVKLFCSKVGIALTEDFDRDAALIAANIMQYTANVDGKIIITGSENAQDIKMLANSLQTLCSGREFEVRESMLTNPKTVEALSTYAGAIFVESAGKSSMSSLLTEKKKAEDFGVTVVGCILME